MTSEQQPTVSNGRSIFGSQGWSRTYIGLHRTRRRHKYFQTQRNVENAFKNRMWQLGFNKVIDKKGRKRRRARPNKMIVQYVTICCFTSRTYILYQTLFYSLFVIIWKWKTWQMKIKKNCKSYKIKRNVLNKKGDNELRSKWQISK